MKSSNLYHIALQDLRLFSSFISVTPGLVEAMTLTKFSTPRHRYASVKPSISPEPVICEVCQTEMPNPQVLQSHKLCHFNSCHVCYVCDSYFTHADTLILHMATIHRNLNTASKPSDDGREWFVCPVCLQRFTTNSALLKHQAGHNVTDSKNFNCRVCGLDFIGSRALMVHLSSSRHNEMKVKMQGVFVCVDCRSIFASRDAYAMHMMLRAQTESCSTALAPTTLSHTTKIDMVSESHSDTSTSAPSSKPPSRAGSVVTGSRNSSPLNLTTSTPSLVPVNQSGFVKPAYSCTKCLATFVNQDALAVHLVMHSAMEKGQEMRLASWAATRPNSAPVGILNSDKMQSPWMCGRCLIAFDTCDSLAMHMMTKHANESEHERPNGPLVAVPQHVIPADQMHTQVSVIRNEELMAKIASLQNNRPSSAGKRSSMVQDKDLELGVKRCKSSDDASSTSWFECPGCKQMFNVRMEWYKHVLVCGQPQRSSHHCEACDMVFLDGHALGVHMRSQHHRDRTTAQCLCSYCGWVAPDTTTLHSHMEVHNKSEGADDVTSSGRQQDSPTDGTSDEPTGEENSRTNNHREPLNLVCSDRHDIPGHKHKGTDSPEPSIALQQLIDRCDPGRTTPKAMPGSTTPGTSGVGSSAEDSCEGDIIDYVLTHAKDLAMCKYCKIVYTDKTLYYLHMGLHNLNNPWQCNMCGKVCHDIHEFTSHVIHY